MAYSEEIQSRLDSFAIQYIKRSGDILDKSIHYWHIADEVWPSGAWASGYLGAVKIDGPTTAGYILTADSNGWGTWQEPPPVVTSFLGLTDTPNSYAGFTASGVRVNPGESGLEFYPITSGGGGGGYAAYYRTFVYSDLVSGKLTVLHNLGHKYNVIQVFDNNDNLIIPDEVTLDSTTQCTLDLRGYGAIIGTWKVVVGTGGDNLDHSALNNLGWSVAGHIINSNFVPVSSGVYQVGTAALPFSEVHCNYIYGDGSHLTGMTSFSGYSGYSGVSGYSGYSGSGYSGYSGSAANDLIKAWVNFDGTTGGTGNCTIKGSSNVSSVKHDAFGSYTVHFTSNMADTNYAVTFGFDNTNSATTAFMISGTKAVGSFGMTTQRVGVGNVDNAEVSVIVVR